MSITGPTTSTGSTTRCIARASNMPTRMSPTALAAATLGTGLESATAWISAAATASRCSSPAIAPATVQGIVPATAPEIVRAIGPVIVLATGQAIVAATALAIAVVIVLVQGIAPKAAAIAP